MGQLLLLFLMMLGITLLVALREDSA